MQEKCDFFVFFVDFAPPENFSGGFHQHHGPNTAKVPQQNGSKKLIYLSELTLVFRAEDETVVDNKVENAGNSKRQNITDQHIPPFGIGGGDPDDGR